MMKNTEGRNEQARLIRTARQNGFKVIQLFGGYIPTGFRYLCGRFYTTAPKGAIK
jgi:hypothetical protein